MEARHVEIPLQSRPKRLGQPYHGLVTDGELTLSTGVKLGFPGAFGDCYLLQVPGVAPLEMSPEEVAIEAAAGREWRTYALLSGRARQYGGVAVGTNAWLYAAPDGTVWRIRCLQLDNTLIHPTPLPDNNWGYYPASLDFEFEVSRFGLISPDGEPDTAVINVPGVRIGPETGWRSDYFRDYSDGEPIRPESRRFPGDGFMIQWLPINIDDVSSDGSRCLFCCNRSAEQSAGNLPSSLGRAYPLSWLEVSVSGGGSAADIAISIALVKQNPTEDDYTSTWDIVMSSVPDGVLVTTNPVTYYDDNGDVVLVARNRTGTTWSSSKEVKAGDHRTQIVPTRYAGGYYDNSDALAWASVGQVTIVDDVTGTGEHAVGSMTTQEGEVWSENGAWGPYPITLGAWPFTYTCNVHQLVTVTSSVTIGGHGLAVPPLELEQSASLVRQGIEPFSDFNPGFPSSMTYSLYARITCAFGEFTKTATDWNSWWGGISINGLHEGNGGDWGAYMGAFVDNPNVLRGINIRDVDHVRLVRMNNKCYALVATGAAPGWPFDLQQRVIAIGTPDGWTMVNASGNDYFASYNPGTAQFASSPNKGVGWV